MGRIRILFLALLCMALTYGAKAQKFQVPENYSFDSKEGYHKYDNDIINCVNWLEKTPYKENNDKIKRAGNFLAEWVTGCPYVHFSQNIRIETVFSNSPELRVYYIGGWARYALQTPGKMDKVQYCMAGLRCAIKVYQDNRTITRDVNIDEIADLDKEGKLKEWVEDRM